MDHLPDGDTLEVFVEDTLDHGQLRVPADLVVLSVAAAPNDGAVKLAEILDIETDDYGFIARKDPAISADIGSRRGRSRWSRWTSPDRPGSGSWCVTAG